mmetsp:Transcript_6989/g.14593  ORF Transcript_6989/g.14593 Transcript_6989/m.14593 type:complete len:351 (+) Transcript_6989:1-1053(+)
MKHPTSVASIILLSRFTHAFHCGNQKQRSHLATSPLHYVTSTGSHPTSGNTNGAPNKALHAPAWVPMELVELAAEDSSIPLSEFVSRYADIEAYTSCDDDGDDLHECDFFGQYLGPTKWLHLTPEAQTSVIDQVHFVIWKDVWSHPHSMVDVADKVSKETLRHFREFVLQSREPNTTSLKENNSEIKVKVVPASFGLEGFEDAVWEATENLLISHYYENEDRNTSDSEAVTFVVAAPDLNDPILTEQDNERTKSPQAEFDPDGFRKFTSGLWEKLQLFSKMEGGISNELVENLICLTSHHPQWRNPREDGVVHSSGTPLKERLQTCSCFPYPCVALVHTWTKYHDEILAV